MRSCKLFLYFSPIALKLAPGNHEGIYRTVSQRRQNHPKNKIVKQNVRNGIVSTNHFPGIEESANSAATSLADFTSGSLDPSRGEVDTSYP